MSKIVLLLILGFIIYLLIKRMTASKIIPPSPKPVEDIVQCAHCGVYSPKRGSFLIANQYYCCVEHSKQND